MLKFHLAESDDVLNPAEEPHSSQKGKLLCKIFGSLLLQLPVDALCLTPGSSLPFIISFSDLCCATGFRRWQKVGKEGGPADSAQHGDFESDREPLWRFGACECGFASFIRSPKLTPNHFWHPISFFYIYVFLNTDFIKKNIGTNTPILIAGKLDNPEISLRHTIYIYIFSLK